MYFIHLFIYLFLFIYYKIGIHLEIHLPIIKAKRMEKRKNSITKIKSVCLSTGYGTKPTEVTSAFGLFKFSYEISNGVRKCSDIDFL